MTYATHATTTHGPLPGLKLPLFVSAALLSTALLSIAAAATSDGKPMALAAKMTPAALNMPAPDFTLTDLNGKSVHLKDYLGKTVVLEWFNPDCPFVRYAHTKGPLKDMGARYARRGVVWLGINSGAQGKEGAGLERNQAAVKEYTLPYPILIDEKGTVGRAYGARSTPHMFVIDHKGVLIYRGAIDNAPLGEVNAGAQEVTNYVDAALAFIDQPAGKTLKANDTKAYGCSVKYGP